MSDRDLAAGLRTLAKWLERNSDESSVSLANAAAVRIDGFSMAEQDYKRRTKRLKETVNELQQRHEDDEWGDK
jgi:hypothetical protein